ncbi:MAG: hypothetical protein R3F61_19470 [Myxococcota bacterium]
MWMLAAWIGSASAEPPPSPPEGTVETNASMAFHDVLAAAKASIDRGANADARAMLEGLAKRLDAGEEPPRSIAHEALVYLGDLRYLAGEQDGARQVFRRVLLEDPAHVISPYHHTEDVRAYFALVRDQVEKELAAIPPPDPVPIPRIPPLPLHGYLPFGAPQFAQGRGTRGVLFGGMQLAFAATSVTTYVITNRANVDPGGTAGHPFNWSADQVPSRVASLRYGVQWPATALFYAAWAGSIVEASAGWRRSHRVQPAATLVVTPSGVVVGARF